MIYRTPDIKPLCMETELERVSPQLKDRGEKGQGEFELPSAVYVSRGLKNLGISLPFCGSCSI